VVVVVDSQRVEDYKVNVSSAQTAVVAVPPHDQYTEKSKSLAGIGNGASPIPAWFPQ
jgi:hypothetical protein